MQSLIDEPTDVTYLTNEEHVNHMHEIAQYYVTQSREAKEDEVEIPVDVGGLSFEARIALWPSEGEYPVWRVQVEVRHFYSTRNLLLCSPTVFHKDRA